MVIHWQCPVVHCVYLSIPIIGKLCGFGRGVISFPRIVSASSPRKRRRKHRKCKCARIALFPYVRVIAHYAHVGHATKESGVCGTFMYAPRAVPCRAVSRIPRNEKRQCISSGRIRRVRKKNWSPRHTPGFSPSIYTRIDRYDSSRVTLTPPDSFVCNTSFTETGKWWDIWDEHLELLITDQYNLEFLLEI